MFSNSTAFGMQSLFGGVQERVQRLQHRLSELANPSTSPPPPITASCALASAFVCHNNTSDTINLAATPSIHTSLRINPVAATERSELVLTALDGISLHIASYLDGFTLGRLQRVNRAWRQFILQHRESLYRHLLDNDTAFHSVIRSSTAFKSFLFTVRNEVDLELLHTALVQRTHAVFEEYCTTIEPVNHGFIAMFCDVVQFRDVRIAQAVAQRRQSALGMILASTPEHVQAFRQKCPNAGPITFVPVDNPHWPQFDLPPVQFPGCRGYAFDHVEVVRGYESLKPTVVKSILKELLIFETQADADAYTQAVGRRPYACVLDTDAATPWKSLMFSSPLREQLRHLPVDERIKCLRRRVDAIDNSIGCC